MKNSKDDEKEKADRRKAIKIIGGGAIAGGAAKTWQKPVVDSVVIPAHAAMTGQDGGGVPGVGQPMPFTTAPPPTTGLQSDSRLKSDISRLTTTVNGHQLYSFRYVRDSSEQTYVGVMAQDLVDSHPQVLTTDEEGYYRVNYEQLGLRMVSLEEWQQHGPNSVSVLN